MPIKPLAPTLCFLSAPRTILARRATQSLIRSVLKRNQSRKICGETASQIPAFGVWISLKFPSVLVQNLVPQTSLIFLSEPYFFLDQAMNAFRLCSQWQKSLLVVWSSGG